MTRRYVFWFLALGFLGFLGNMQGWLVEAGTITGGTAVTLGGLDSFANTVQSVSERQRRQDAGDDPGDCRYRHGGGGQDGLGHQRPGSGGLRLPSCRTSSATPSTRQPLTLWQA